VPPGPTPTNPTPPPAPESVTGLTADGADGHVVLTYAVPAEDGTGTVAIRRAEGTQAPVDASTGVSAGQVSTATSSFSDTSAALTPGHTYSYALFVTTPSGTSPATNVTVTVLPFTTFRLCQDITSDSSWSPAFATTYVLDCAVTVRPGVTLTVSPGSVIKASPSGALNVAGNLIMTAPTRGSPGALFASTDDVRPWGSFDTSVGTPWSGITFGDGANLTATGLELRDAPLSMATHSDGKSAVMSSVSLSTSTLQDSAVRLMFSVSADLAAASIHNPARTVVLPTQLYSSSGAPITITNGDIDAGLTVEASGPLSITHSTIRGLRGLDPALVPGVLNLVGDPGPGTLTLSDLTLDGSRMATDIPDFTNVGTLDGIMVMMDPAAGPARTPHLDGLTISYVNRAVRISGSQLDSTALVPTHVTTWNTSLPYSFADGALATDLLIGPTAAGALPVAAGPATLIVPVGRRLEIAADATLPVAGKQLDVQGLLVSNGTVGHPAAVTKIDDVGGGRVFLNDNGGFDLHDLVLTGWGLTSTGTGPVSLERITVQHAQARDNVQTCSYLVVNGAINVTGFASNDVSCTRNSGTPDVLSLVQTGSAKTTAHTISVTDSSAPEGHGIDLESFAVGAAPITAADLTVTNLQGPAYEIGGSSLDPTLWTNLLSTGSTRNTLDLQGTVTAPLTLPRADLPPVVAGQAAPPICVNDSCGVRTALVFGPSASLTLHAGSVLKVADAADGPLVLGGGLTVDGTSASPAIVALLADDIGGDVGDDGDASSAPTTVWAGLTVDGAQPVEVSHLVLHGGGMEITRATQTSIADSTFQDIGGVVVTSGGSTTIVRNSVKGVVARSQLAGHLGQGNGITVRSSSAPVSVENNTIVPGVLAADVPENVGVDVTVTGTSPAPVVRGNAVRRVGLAYSISGSLLPDHLTGNTAVGAQRPVLQVSGALDQDLALPWDGLPVAVASAGLTISPDVVLTLSAEQTLKSSGAIRVLGTLAAEGTPGSPVTFTSMRADDPDGDSNGDGSSTSAAPGDWPGIVVDGDGTVTLAGTRIEYASVGIRNNTEGTVEIHGEITHNAIGVSNSDAGGVVNAQAVWWGHPTGPAPVGSGDRIEGNGIAYEPLSLAGLRDTGTYALDPNAGIVDDLNPSLAALVLQQPDVSVAVPGPALVNTRIYNSQDTRIGGYFGHGWSSTYEVSLALTGSLGNPGAMATINQPDGSSESFLGSSGAWLAPAGSSSTLAQAGSAFTYTTGDMLAYAFDTGTGRLLSVKDQYARSLTFNYAAGQLSDVTSSTGRALHYTWTGNHIASVSTDAVAASGRALTWRFSYTGDELTKVCDPRYDDSTATGCTTIAMASGKIASVTTPGGSVTSTTYDAKGRVASTTDPLGHATQVTYVLPRTAITTDPMGRATAHTYDTRGRLVREKTADGNSTTYNYDAATGQRLSASDPLGNTTRYTYTAKGQLATDTDPNGNTVYDTYDSAGNLVQVRGRRSESATSDTYLTTYTYDSLGQRIKDVSPPTAASPQGEVTTRTFSDGSTAAVGGGVVPGGLVLSTTDPRGAVTSYSYDSSGDRVKVVEPSGQTTSTSYDELGRPTSSIRVSDSHPAGLVTSVVYDVLGRVTSKSSPATKDSVTGQTHQLLMSYGYDSDSDVITTTLKDAVTGETRTTTLSYDAAHRPTKAVDPLGNVTSRTYDADGEVAEVIDAAGRHTRYGYDVRGDRITQTLLDFVEDPIAHTTARDLVVMRYGYDAAARLVTTTDAIGARTITRYDRDGNTVQTLVSQPANNGPQADINLGTSTFDENGNIVTRTFGGVGSGRLEVRESYDALDNPIKETFDPSGTGRSIAWSRQAGGLATQTTYRQGSVTEQESATYDIVGQQLADAFATGTSTLTTSFTWDQEGNILSKVTPRGTQSGATESAYTTSMTYDEFGRQIQLRAPPVSVTVQGATTTNARPAQLQGFDAFGDLVSTKDANGNVTTYDYDAIGRLITVHWPQVTNPDGTTVNATESRSYDSVGNLISRVDRRGQTWTWTYDALNRPVKRVAPAVNGVSGVYRWAYDDSGNVTATTDELGAVTTSTYDHRHLQTSMTQLVRKVGGTQSNLWTFRYDDIGNKISETEPDGSQHSYTYNALSELTGGLDEDGVYRTRTYDVRGRLASVSDGERRTVFERDRAGRVTGSTQSWADSRKTETLHTSYTVDADGNTTKQVSPAGRERSWTYDALGRTATSTSVVTASHSISSQLGYDAQGNLTSVTDGRGNATTTRYNAWNQADRIVEPSTTAYPNLADRTWAVNYDSAGTPTSLNQPGGVTLTRSYDALGRVVAEDGAGAGFSAQTRDWGYDLVGDLTSISTPASHQSVTYDDRRLPISSSGPEGAMSMSYDKRGLPATRTNALGTAAYSYDSNGRLQTATDPLTNTEQTLGYDKSGNVATVDTRSGATRTQIETRVYDLQNDTTSVTDYHPGASVAASPYAQDERTYDDDGLLLTTTTTLAAAKTTTWTQSFTHDGVGRVTSATGPDGKTTSYTWDDANNRTGSGSQTSSFDARNRLISQGGQAISYDARGDRLTDDKGASLAYDVFGQVTSQGGVAFTYDANGRVASRAGTQFSYDGLDRSPVADGVSTYNWRPDGQLASVKQTGMVAKDIVLNGRGDPAFAASVASGPDAALVYGPFGDVIASSGAMPGQIRNDLGWSDPTTGNTDLSARWYDPSSGSFLSRDSIMGDLNDPLTLNRYTYANGDPLDNIDPDGTWSIKGAFRAVTQVVHTVTRAVATAVKAVSRVVTNAVRAVVNTVSSAVRTVTRAAAGAVVHAVSRVVGAAQQFAEAAITTVERTTQQILAACTDRATLCGRVTAFSLSAITSTVNVVKEVGSVAIEAAKLQINAQISFAQGFINGATSALTFGLLKTDFNYCPFTSSGAQRTTCTVARAVGNITGEIAGVVAVTILTDGAGTAAEGANLTRVVAETGNEIREVNSAAKAAKIIKSGAKVCEPNSFTGDTPVTMADGSQKPISAVKVGDKVLATDPETGETGGRSVTQLIVHSGEHTMVDIHLADGTSVRATDQHPIWDATTGKFTHAIDLRPGDALRKSDGTLVTVVSTTVHNEVVTAYNLAVDGIHTYFAGTAAVLVHNTCSFGKAVGDAADSAANWVPKAKHLAGAGGKWAKFAADTNPSALVEEALRTEGKNILPNAGGLADRFIVEADMGRVIGTKGERWLKVVVSDAGKIITSYPVKR
jgi:RHS repeat-associated protein